MGGNSLNGGATRLDGLISLLESGSNASVRKMAANQLGELVAAHSSETRPVLCRVRRLLFSSSWEARVAAGQAIAAIADQSPRFVPSTPTSKSEPILNYHPSTNDQHPLKEESLLHAQKNEPAPVDTFAPAVASSSDLPPSNAAIESGLQFDSFDLDKLLRQGAMLFASSGEEYKGVDTDVAAQRARLKADLGLDDRFSNGGDMLGLRDEDLVTHQSNAPVQTNGAEHTTAPAECIAEMSNSGISARERNRLKRMAKRKARQGGDALVGKPLKRPRTPGDAASSAEISSEVFSLSDLSGTNDQAEFEDRFGPAYWDFQPTCEALKEGLLLPKWEWRHGAAIGLRQILMRHAASAGRVLSGSSGDEENANWLEDLCCRLLCVLALDKFGDFVGDAVVAPVREAAAMTMGACCRVMSPQKTFSLMERVLYLLSTEKSSQWEVRHAALLGARFLLAVKEDMARELITSTFDRITTGLQDRDDDVRAVAAEALLPVVPKIISFIPEKVPRLVTTLWEALLDLDDICASTSSIMRLLSEITSYPSPPGCNTLWLDPDALMDSSEPEDEESMNMDIKADASQKPVYMVLVDLVPRLWPFFRHSSKGVRRAAIKLLETVTGSFDDEELTAWLHPISSDLFPRLFRNVLLESEAETLLISQKVWERGVKAIGAKRQNSNSFLNAFSPVLSHWLRVASQDTRAEAAEYDEAREKSKITASAARRKAAALRRAAKLKKAQGSIGVIPQNLQGGDSAPTIEGPYDGALMQRNAAMALGYLAVFWPSDDPTLENSLLEALQSPFGITRRFAYDVCEQWATKSQYESFVFSERIKASVEKEISADSSCPFAEVGACVGSFFTDSVAFLDSVPAQLDGVGLDFQSMRATCGEGKKAVLARDVSMAALCARSLKPNMYQLVTGDMWEYVLKSIQNVGVRRGTVNAVESLRMRILSSLGYMDLREETSKVSLASSATSALVAAVGCHLPQKVGPLIRSLTAAIRSMTNPHLQAQSAHALSKLASRLAPRDPKKPLSLMTKNIMKYLTSSDAGNEKEIFSSIKATVTVNLDAPSLAKRGAYLTCREFCYTFKELLFSQLPWLWARIQDPLISNNSAEPSAEVLEAMIILRSIVSYVDHKLHETVAKLFPFIVDLCAAPHDHFISQSSLCLADSVAAIPKEGMEAVVGRLIPSLSGSLDKKESDMFSRRGAATALRAVVEKMGTSLIPYAAFMIVPMMTRMVDEDEVVRDAAAGVFGTLVRLMPLEGGVPDDAYMSESMAEERRNARLFLGQLLGSEPRSHYQLPISIGDSIVLRKYQQECLDWLAFLNRYGLHGALCDDMGLGKTLMTLCMIAGDFASRSAEGRALPSLVACPSTIVAHWVMEAERFFGHVFGTVLHYAGAPKARARIRDSVHMQSSSLIVTSYDVLSNDLRYLEPLRWNYLVLDEGHVIKNSKTKIARAVRSLSSDHRLILTGTPIQNSVLELWSMFDFLMPGFLGSEKSFKETYSKPIMASRDSKCTEVDHEKGVLATEALHRQVLPFVLRRLKDDVLSELPPKIMQDYFCNMTPLQHRLYEDFATDFQQGGGLSSGSGVEESNGKGGSHVFKALSYMRRLCSHPKLVLSPKHPEYIAVHRALREQGKTIDDITSSAKLVGLMNILKECGIGNSQAEGGQSGGHRALIFAQLKDMLDLVENDLFKQHMPDVTYLRLDGSVETSKRQPIVTRFNADPTIDCLLLTTHVGGLGLNLTGADTVIFLEHDWNPTKDLQAMDRAHRMGQKRTVNVYRLITRGTLEEKIMSIQRFKTHIANTVVNRENSTLQSMNTEQLLDLFKVENADAVVVDDSQAELSLGTGKGLKAALAGLGELWEENQYEEEYNMDAFLSGMDKGK